MARNCMTTSNSCRRCTWAHPIHIDFSTPASVNPAWEGSSDHEQQLTDRNSGLDPVCTATEVATPCHWWCVRRGNKGMQAMSRVPVRSSTMSVWAKNLRRWVAWRTRRHLWHPVHAQALPATPLDTARTCAVPNGATSSPCLAAYYANIVVLVSQTQRGARDTHVHILWYMFDQALDGAQVSPEPTQCLTPLKSTLVWCGTKHTWFCRTWHLHAGRLSPILARLCDSGGVHCLHCGTWTTLQWAQRREATKEAPAPEVLNHLAVGIIK